MIEIKYSTRQTSSDNPEINELMRQREIAHNNMDDKKFKELTQQIQKIKNRERVAKIYKKRREFNSIIFSEKSNN